MSISNYGGIPDYETDLQKILQNRQLGVPNSGLTQPGPNNFRRVMDLAKKVATPKYSPSPPKGHPAQTGVVNRGRNKRSAIDMLQNAWDNYKNSASTENFNPEPQIPSYNMPMYSKSLEDFMRMASQQTASGYEKIGAGLDAREAALRKNAELANSAIGGIYGDVVDHLGESRENIGQSYDETNQAILDSGKSAVKGMTGAFDESQNIQADIARNLGIEDALVGLHESGNQAKKDLDFSVDRTTQKYQGDSAEMLSNRAAQMDLNTGMVDSANLRSAEEKTLVQNDLMNYLAQLEDERASVALQQERDNMSLAQQLYNDDYNRFMQDQQMRYGMFNDQRNFQLGLDDRQWDQERYFRDQAFQEQMFNMETERSMAGQSAPETKYSDLGMYNQFQQNTQQALQRAGINPSKSGSVDRFIQNALRTNTGNKAMRNGDMARFAEEVINNSDGSIPNELLWGLASQYFQMTYIK